MEKETNVEVDTLVLIKDEHVASTKWTMERIIQVHPGANGLVKIVKTAD